AHDSSFLVGKPRQHKEREEGIASLFSHFLEFTPRKKGLPSLVGPPRGFDLSRGSLAYFPRSPRSTGGGGGGGGGGGAGQVAVARITEPTGQVCVAGGGGAGGGGGGGGGGG